MTTNRYLNLSRYDLLHLPAHLVGGNRTDGLVKLLTDEEFLEHKVESSMVSQLISDLRLTIDTNTSASQWHGFLTLISNAISRDLDFIARHPSSLFQCLWNLCWWHDAPEALDHYLESKAYLSTSDISGKPCGPDLHSWMEEWRKKKETAPGFIWVREYRPPC